jgi:hypothetical protein
MDQNGYREAVRSGFDPGISALTRRCPEYMFHTPETAAAPETCQMHSNAIRCNRYMWVRQLTRES